MNISNYTEEQIQAIVGANETRKNKHKVAMKKWYDKKTKLKEDATIEDIQTLKKDIEKKELEGKISEVINKAQEKDELKDIMKEFKEIQAKLKFINE